MASVPGSAAPSLFLRNATGLVKGWSGFDAFTYSFMSVNLVTLGMFYSLAVFAYVPGANPILSIVLAAIAVTFLAVAYAGLIAAMPRAGGDYVWQSRILDGIHGTLTVAIFGWIVLALSVVSLPMLVDRDVSASEAVSASWRAAHANKSEMIRWGIVVTALLVLGSLPLFVGLAFVLPWLGYSTWHLYARLIDRDAIRGARRSA